MIADAPYLSSKLVLHPLKAALVGCAGSLMMLLALVATSLLRPFSVRSLLEALGALATNRDGAVWVGLVVMVAVGALLGALYGASQERIRTAGLVVVGASYGTLIWGVGGLILRLFESPAIRNLAHTWHWLIACVVYGLTLGLASIMSRSDATTVIAD